MKDEGSKPSAQETPEVSIFELPPDDWSKFRDLKIRSLKAEPAAFEDAETGTEKYLNRTEAEWRDILSGKMSGGKAGESMHVFARVGENIVGMVSAIIPESPVKIATIQHMYVDPERRGQQIGRKLFETMRDKLKLRSDLGKIELNVLASQIPAIEMYKSCGFREVSRKEKAVTRAGREYDELHMELMPPDR